MIHTLYYIHDPMCAWCYAFKPTFEKLKKELADNIKVVYVPGGLASHTNEVMPMEMRKTIQSYWYQITDQVGTKFNHDFWEKCTPRRSTYLSCQATLAAKKQKKEVEMIAGIQEAYYLKAMNPSDEKTLVKVAKNLNLDIEKFKKDLYSEETIKEFEQARQLRSKLYLNSFPSLAIKYKKEVYPINIKYNNHEYMLNEIKNHVENVYF